VSGGLGSLSARACPVCGSRDDRNVFADQALDEKSMDRFAFASRKRPEHMRLRLVACPVCALVYASPLPGADALAAAYDDAAFDTAEEARFAARTYANVLQALLPRLPDRKGALDIGTGEGGFLGELLDLRFLDVGGVEPSRAPIAAADPRVAGLIEHSVFHAGIRSPRSQSLVTCFQTLEHVHDPAALVRDAVSLLKPGGMFLVVCHDRDAFVNRALGLRSPIVDIEHVQIFNRRSLRELLTRAGLRSVATESITNCYPIRYWTRLLPVPDTVYGPLSSALERTRIAARPLTLRVGNLSAWGFAPLS
jgi:SAM-dependent methyltransferase